MGTGVAGLSCGGWAARCVGRESLRVLCLASNLEDKSEIRHHRASLNSDIPRLSPRLLFFQESLFIPASLYAARMYASQSSVVQFAPMQSVRNSARSHPMPEKTAQATNEASDLQACFQRVAQKLKYTKNTDEDHNFQEASIFIYAIQEAWERALIVIGAAGLGHDTMSWSGGHTCYL